MRLNIQYTFSPSLVRRLYVDQAREITSATIALVPACLTPVARQAALEAKLLPPYSSAPVAAAERYELTLQVADPVDEEPDQIRAIADAERLLLELVAATPQLEADWAAEQSRIAAEKAAAEAEKAETHAAAIEAIRDGGLDSLLRRSDGEWLSTWERDSSARNRQAMEALGSDCSGRATAEAHRRNDAERDERRGVDAAWIAEHAPDLVARHADGWLPEAELLARLRDHVLRDLAEEPRYQRLEKGDLVHADECYQADASYHVGDAEELTEEQYQRFQRLIRLSPEGATVEPREHAGWCSGCAARNVAQLRHSALVTVTVLGRTLSREYAL